MLAGLGGLPLIPKDEVENMCNVKGAIARAVSV